MLSFISLSIPLRCIFTCSCMSLYTKSKALSNFFLRVRRCRSTYPQTNVLRPKLRFRSVSFKPESSLLIRPVVKTRLTLLTRSLGYSLYPEFAVLRYFSYTIAILQRAGKRVFYWSLGTEVMSAISRLVSSENGTSKSELAGSRLTSLKSEERWSEVMIQGVDARESSWTSSSLISPCVKSLLFTLWVRSELTNLPTVQPSNKIGLNPNTQGFLQICQRLRISFMVRYRSLDRKLRKIVKNKYRYSRSYVMLKPSNRVKHGLRFILLGLSLRSNLKMQDCLLSLLFDVLFVPESSILLEVRNKHQNVALTALALSR